MKIFTYFRKMNKLGAAMVEYAVILAFVAAVGSSFTDNISPGVNNIIKSVSSMLGLAANESETKTTQQRIYDSFTALNGKTHGGNPWESLEKDIVSSCVYIEKIANIDTAYSVRTNMTDAAKQAGLIPQTATNCKLITVANESGIPPTAGNENDPGTHFSATQYLFYQEGKKLYLAQTRSLDTVYVHEEGKHLTIASGEEYGYTQKYDFTKGKYKVGENNWKYLHELHDLSSFVKYEPK